MRRFILLSFALIGGVEAQDKHQNHYNETKGWVQKTIKGLDNPNYKKTPEEVMGDYDFSKGLNHAKAETLGGDPNTLESRGKKAIEANEDFKNVDKIEKEAQGYTFENDPVFDSMEQVIADPASVISQNYGDCHYEKGQGDTQTFVTKKKCRKGDRTKVVTCDDHIAVEVKKNGWTTHRWI